MKKLFVILWFQLLFSCISKSNNDQTKDYKKSDTTVVIQLVPTEISGKGRIEKEYFLVVANDTSSFSCVLSENKINGAFSMHYRTTPYGKMPVSFSSEDTLAVMVDKQKKKSYRKIAYKEQLGELGFLLHYVSKDYNLNKLSNFRFAMGSIDGLSQYTLDKYIDQYGAINYKSNHKVADLIKNSYFTADLNNIISPYSITIHEISIDNLMLYKLQDSTGETKQVLDGMIIFSLIP